MLDPKNSTQTISKGETNTRPRPIGGDFASLEEEPQSTTNLENPFSAFGKLDFQPAIKIASSLFKAGEWTTLAVGEGIKEVGGSLKGLAKEVFVSEKPKAQPKPEDKKKTEDGLALRQAMRVIENALAQNSHQKSIDAKKEEVRIIGRPISMEEASRKLNKSASFTGLSGRLSYYDLVELRRIETEEEKQVKQAKMQQNSIATSKGENLSNRTDAQEGQSTTGNAIATAG